MFNVPKLLHIFYHKIIKFKKGVGIAIKSKETSSNLADHTNTVGRYTHACINEAHSLVNLHDLIPTLAGLCCL